MRTERLLLCLIALGPAVASAYTLTGITWSWQDHPIEDPFYLDTGSFPADEVSGDAVETALLAAMDSWNDVGLDLTLNYGGLIDGGTRTTDGFFHIFYAESYSNSSEGSLAFASTWSTTNYDGVDCDITFLGENSSGSITWSADSDGAEDGEYDVEAVVLHELGHCLGLNHSDSTNAVMYAYYQGYRDLTGDDLDGVAALYGDPCEDGDGDGYTGCDFDCDDDNAAINPGASEICDGADNNCDGIIDSAEEVISAIGDVSLFGDTGWTAFGNVFTIDHDTVLRSMSQKMSADVGSRLAWTVYVAEKPEGPYELVHSGISHAIDETWQESPALNVPLEAGLTYEVSLGVMADEQTYWYDSSPELVEQDGLTLLGGVYGIAIGNDNHGIDGNYLFPQKLTLIRPADTDSDGLTDLCGDCDDDNADALPDGTEVCDGVDNDCDGEIDEDYANDIDGDGVYDCLDPCPYDVYDDSDGDGSCDSDDPCPTDPTDACGDTGSDTSPPTDTGVPPEEPGGCSCAAGGPGGVLAALLLLPMIISRRRRQ